MDEWWIIHGAGNVLWDDPQNPKRVTRWYPGESYEGFKGEIVKEESLQHFPSGAVRSTREGKGRYDLISPFAWRRVAIVSQKGGEHKGDRNWEKGFEWSRCIDSALRHIIQYMMGDRSEDHPAQAVWNLNALMQFEATHPECNDLPNYQRKEEHEKNSLP